MSGFINNKPLTTEVAAIQAEVDNLDGEAMRGTDSAATAVNLAVAQTSIDDSIGSGISGRVITATLYVSPGGDDSDGSSWAKAYQTIQGALDAASTDANDCTLILVAPHATYYNINTTGDPTWSGNYEIVGTHRKWTAIKNTHESATSIFKFTGKASIKNLAIFTQGTVNGVIFTKDGWRVRNCGFNSSTTTGATTSVYIDGSAATTRGGIMEDVQFIGNVSYTKAIYINQSSVNEFRSVTIHYCLTGVQIADTDSDNNEFNNIVFGDCALAVDIDAGNDQHFYDINFHDNTLNVDDEVGDHSWRGIRGNFPISIYPDDLTGLTVPTHANANTWGTDTEFRAAATATKPFKVLGVIAIPSVSEKFRIRLSGDSGSTFFDDIYIDATKRTSSAAAVGTDYIFNQGTRISGSCQSESGGDTLTVWLKIQEI